MVGSSEGDLLGDIDTHGFAILDRARRAVPQLQSVLMEERTLLSHRSLWGTESSQCPNVPLDALTAKEKTVYDGLRINSWGHNVRLEQERLEWGAAMAVLAHALNTDETATVLGRDDDEVTGLDNV